MSFRRDIGSHLGNGILVGLRYRLYQLLLLIFWASPAYTQVLTSRPPRVESFSPLGVVKQVRQVQVRFSEQMVSFGDPGVVPPFDPVSRKLLRSSVPKRDGLPGLMV